MTMVIEITDPTKIEPISEKLLDLDSTIEYAEFEKMYPDIVMSVCHLYPGESIVFKCLERDDAY